MANRGGNRVRKNVEEFADSTINYVQCNGLAVMKIVKHCHEESNMSSELAQGALLGLVVDKCLEITNCFPFLKTDDDNMDEEMYQLTMMRRLRCVNVDHFHVGWYQTSDVDNFLTVALLKSQFHYETSIEESVVLVYDTQKSSRGFLCLKAYRLTPQAIQMYKDNDFSSKSMRNLKMGYKRLFVEIPVVIKNSPLSNIMMREVNKMIPVGQGYNFLDSTTTSVLENHMHCLIECVDELYEDSTSYSKYQKAAFKMETEKHRSLAKLAAENALRVAKDESPIPKDEVLKLLRPLPVPVQLNSTIVSSQINTYSQHISQFCSQSLAKLLITQTLQKAKEAKHAK